MSDPFTNLVEKTGRSMAEWIVIVEASGLSKHSEIVSWLKSDHGLTHGFANGIALAFRNRDETHTEGDLVAAQYAGARAALLPIYTRVITAAEALGSDVTIVPKKTGVSIRRSLQFALIEATSAKRIQLGLQLRDEPTSDRLLPGNAMCSHKVFLTQITDVDDELLLWLRTAYERN